MLIFKIIWCKIGEVFWGCIANISEKLASLFEPNWEALEKGLGRKDK